MGGEGWRGPCLPGNTPSVARRETPFGVPSPERETRETPCEQCVAEQAVKPVSRRGDSGRQRPKTGPRRLRAVSRPGDTLLRIFGHMPGVPAVLAFVHDPAMLFQFVQNLLDRLVASA